MRLSAFVGEMAKPITRNIEVVAEVARQYGLPFPKTYQVGMAPTDYSPDRTIAHIRVRIDNVASFHQVKIPQSSDQGTIDSFIEQLRDVAVVAVAEFVKNNDQKAEFDGKVEQFIEGLRNDTGERWEEVSQLAAAAARNAQYIEHKKPGRRN